ncbi:hypothetical protein DMZ43_08175 [Meridianimaribacter sp. CL38]|uniref:hypothetical protein n=1 Tax=Meridianimaribacter sp. CL38 TaxID=2213021 RepID=UPI00103B6841|nr:hypothetical protein [Meridianimaribacter sp. CL38]TBV25877.1 hypothetical protein DMZ43_08175 [Meridianimaribacter sp. CL38]
MKKILFPIIALILFSSCKSESKERENTLESNKKTISKASKLTEQYNLFVEQFPIIKTPIKIKACDDDFSEFIQLNDTNNILDREEFNYIYGKIKINEEYIAVITLEEAECFMPILTTFKINGEIVNSKELMIGLCGSDPCFECEELMEIDNDLNIYVAFNSRYFNCDENGNEIVGTDKKEVIYKTGKITKEGIIELTNEVKKQNPD